MRLAAAALLAAVAGAGPAPAAEGKIVLEPLEVRDAPRPLAALVEQRVCEALVERARGADVVCPEDVAAASTMARNDAIMGRCPSDECMRRVEAMRAGPRRVTGSLAREGKGLVLTLVLRVEGVPDPRIAKGAVPEDLDGLSARVPELVKQLW